MKAAASGMRAWWTVSLLSLLYVLSFIDRLILALLVSPLRADLGISDVQLGLLFGPAFGLFYAIVGLPLARLADRGNRRRLIVAGVLLWGAATVLSGIASTFAMLVALRIGLAIGEAVLTPAAHSMIGDLFPPHRRSLAASIYSAIGQGGAYAGFIIGAAVVSGVQGALSDAGHTSFSAWQLTFFAVGVPTIVVALVFAMTTREPTRLGDHASVSLRELVTYVRRHARLYLCLFAGAGLLQSIPYAWTAWAPEFMHRAFAWRVQDAGLAFGAVGLLAGSAGALAFPMLTRRLEHAGHLDAIARISLISVVCGVAFTVLAVSQSDPLMFLLWLGISTFFTQGVTVNVIVGMQSLASSRMRATLIAGLLLSITLLGLCVGPPVTARIAANVSADGMELGIGVGVLAALIAIPCVCLFAGSRQCLRRRTLDEVIPAMPP